MKNDSVPEYIRPCVEFFRRLYPEPVEYSREEYYALLTVLSEDFGCRVLAKVMHFVFRIEYPTALHDVYTVMARGITVSEESVDAVRNRLEKAGYASLKMQMNV